MHLKASVLLIVSLTSVTYAQLVGPVPGPNIGDHIELPMLVSSGPIALIPGGSKALVGDRQKLKIIDLSTGQVQSTPVAEVTPVRLAIEGTGPTALVLENNELIRVNYTTGAKTVLLTGLNNARGLAIEPGGQTALLSDASHGISRVTLATGVIVSLASVSAGGIALDPGGSSAVFTLPPLQIERINLLTNEISNVAFQTLGSMRGDAIQVSPDDLYAYIIASPGDTGIERVSLADGSETSIASATGSIGGFSISDLALTFDGSAVAATWNTPGDPAVILTRISDSSTIRTIPGITPNAIATESSGTTLLVTSSGAPFGSLYRLDIASGVVAKIIGQFPGADLSVLPSGTDGLLALGSIFGIPGDLLQVDLTTSNQFLRIAQQLGATGVAAEASGSTALVTIGSTLARVDLSTGNVSPIAQGLNSPVGLAIEDSGVSALVGSLFGVYRVNLADGSVSLLTTIEARYIAVEPDTNTAILAVESTGLSRIDLTTNVVTSLATGIHVSGKVAIEAGDSTALVATDNDGIVRVRIRSGLVPPSISSINPTSGVQGQTISNFTVNGSNFDASATLSFSGTGIGVNSYSPRTATQIVASITIASTAATGAYDVTVTNSDGQHATLSGAFSVLPAAPPIPGPPPPPTGIGAPGGPPNQQLTVKEPISTGNGNYLYQHTDLMIPGRGLPLLFQRSYNTLDNYAGPLGTSWTHTYNVILTEDANLTVHIRWGDGHGETYTLNGSTYTPQPGVFNTLFANADGTFTLTQKNQTKYQFLQIGKLTSIQDRNGNTVQLTYDQSGNLVQITDPTGRALNLAYDASNRVTQITDPAGRTVSYQYSTSNDLISAMDAAGGVTQFTYDANHHITSILQPNGQILLQNTYDLSGRVVSQMNGRGATTTLAYDVPIIDSRTITDGRGQQTIHTYDAGMRIVKVTDATNGTTSFTYDANNDRTSITNQIGNTTSFAYDANGNITGITDPLGDSISSTYDPRNNLLTATNAKGNPTSFGYDGNGNLTSIEDALGDQTTFSYDGFGELTSKIDARGNTSNFNYDSFGNLTRISDALGNSTGLSYDQISRLTSIADPNGHTATATYDALSRLRSISDPLGDKTQFAYDAVGNLLKITDANGNATTYAYDGANNLTSVTDALAHLTQYGYDGNNNRVTFTNARGKATAYVFDALNRLATITDPLGFVTSYGYDHAGNVVSITDANGRTNQFTYDALNRLTGIDYADGKTVSYAYDPDGNRTSMVDAHGTTTYAYDVLDRLTSVSNPGGKLVAYGYDAVGNRESETYPDGKLLTYTFDQDNRLSKATDWLARATSYSYDPASNLAQILYPTGSRLNFNYDAANRLQQVVNTYQGSVGNPISSFTYLLDRVGNRLQMTDGSGKATAYGYDKLNELTSVTVGTSVTQFTYDAVGNRLMLTAPGTFIAYSYDAADRLLAAGNTTFAYDKNGNQITEVPPNKKPIAFGYDAANRLISVLGNKINSTFSYDGDGNRIGQTVGSGTYSYTNDVATALPVVLQESGPDGNISYAYGLGELSESGPGFDYFYQYDGLGSVVGLTDPGSKLAGRYSYDAWGNTDTSIPDSQIGTKNKFRYTGEALDPGTQLYYLRARYYDPGVGRFLSRDPVFDQTHDPVTAYPYTYGRNNPLRLTDPSGLTSAEAPSTSMGLVEIGNLRIPRAKLSDPAFVKELQNAFQQESDQATKLEMTLQQIELNTLLRLEIGALGFTVGGVAVVFAESGVIAPEVVEIVQISGRVGNVISAIDSSRILHCFGPHCMLR